MDSETELETLSQDGNINCNTRSKLLAVVQGVLQLGTTSRQDPGGKSRDALPFWLQERVTAAAQARCSRPKDVANAHIDVGNNTLLNARLRYTCNPGYKRKAGTSSLIQCILRDGSKPDWTHTTLQCIPYVQPLAFPIGFTVLLVAAVTACGCCRWRMKMRAGQDYRATAIPMVAPAAENEEMLPPGIFPTG
ncbi:hypothetical protein llap_13566 [Limosa lapponica baueri]|uniref:Sushi domain-containing protein n=1 Tax=Limosa lapponica baueri TaxID=1758121 RepID=A0A2I0TQW2_LIMLA|nr:hypothetical protein llap_13566 [Limosa lapponica baueri]